MGISDTDYKLLWGRAGGICSNPKCRQSLFRFLRDTTYNVGEMAHIIARKPGGPRGVPEGGADTYDNLILLCPACHRTVDKAPEGAFPPELLQRWKAEHEADIHRYGAAQKFATLPELKKFVAALLAENHLLWRKLGPQSPEAKSDLGSNLHRVWDLRKLDTIVPNNNKIIAVIDANSALLDAPATEVFLEFKLHAPAFEQNQYGRLDSYPLFPQEFAAVFRV